MFVHTDAVDGESPEACVHNLQEAVEFLHQVSDGYRPCLQALESIPRDITRGYSLLSFCKVSKLSDVVITLFKAIVFSHVASRFRHSVEEFYSEAFRVFHHVNNDGEQGMVSFRGIELSHVKNRQTAKAQLRLPICTVSPAPLPELSLFTHKI